MNYENIVENIRSYVSLLRNEESRLPKFKVFLDNFDLNLKNFEVSF